MSSILTEFSTEPLLESSNADGGLDVVGQQGESNFFTFEGDGSDNVVGGNEFDMIAGGTGNDVIYGLDGDDNLYGGLGNDIIRGGEGDDLVNGGKGDDDLIGGKGVDIIIGGEGVDIMNGGGGADIFEFLANDFANGEVDQITDFKAGGFADVIRLQGIGSDANVSYDAATGYVSVNDQDIIKLEEGLDVQASDADGNGNWELF